MTVHLPVVKGAERLPPGASTAFAAFSRGRADAFEHFKRWLQTDNPSPEQIWDEIDATWNVLRQLADLYLEERASDE